MSSPVVEAPPYHDLAQAAQSRRDNILGIYERWSTVRRLQGQSPISTKAQCKFWSCHKLPPKRGACRRRLVTTTSSFFNSGTYSKPPLEFTSNWTFGRHLIGASMVLLRRKLYSETKYRPFHGPRLSGHQTISIEVTSGRLVGVMPSLSRVCQSKIYQAKLNPRLWCRSPQLTTDTDRPWCPSNHLGALLPRK